MLPVAGANVYDILRRDTLVLTKDAYEEVCKRDPALGYVFTQNIAKKIVGDLAAMNGRVLRLTQALSIALDKRR